jgi:hypothetical protein
VKKIEVPEVKSGEGQESLEAQTSDTSENTVIEEAQAETPTETSSEVQTQDTVEASSEKTE